MKFNVLEKRVKKGKPANQRAMAEMCLHMAVGQIAGLMEITPEQAYNEIVDQVLGVKNSNTEETKEDDGSKTSDLSRDDLVDEATLSMIASGIDLTQTGKPEVAALNDMLNFEEPVDADERDESFERVSNID